MLARSVSVPEAAAYVGDAPETIMSVYAHFIRESDSMAKWALDLSLSPSRSRPIATRSRHEAHSVTPKCR